MFYPSKLTWTVFPEKHGGHCRIIKVCLFGILVPSGISQAGGPRFGISLAKNECQELPFSSLPATRDPQVKFTGTGDFHKPKSRPYGPPRPSHGTDSSSTSSFLHFRTHSHD